VRWLVAEAALAELVDESGVGGPPAEFAVELGRRPPRWQLVTSNPDWNGQIAFDNSSAMLPA
jgi:hypothetical protein